MLLVILISNDALNWSKVAVKHTVHLNTKIHGAAQMFSTWRKNVSCAEKSAY